MTDFQTKFSTTVVKTMGGFEVVRVPARRIRVGLLTPTYREESEYLAVRRRGADPTDESALIGGIRFSSLQSAIDYARMQDHHVKVYADD